jgi:hypothetical protein
MVIVMSSCGNTNTMEIANYSVTETLRDGTAIPIRAIRPNDKQRLVEHFQGLSLQSVYNRFFGLKRSLRHDDLRRLIEMNFINHVGLAATTGSKGAGALHWRRSVYPHRESFSRGSRIRRARRISRSWYRHPPAEASGEDSAKEWNPRI